MSDDMKELSAIRCHRSLDQLVSKPKSA